MNIRIAHHLDAFRHTLAFLNENAEGFADSAAARGLSLSLDEVIAKIEKATVSAVWNRFPHQKRSGRGAE